MSGIGIWKICKHFVYFSHGPGDLLQTYLEFYVYFNRFLNPKDFKYTICLMSVGAPGTNCDLSSFSCSLTSFCNIFTWDTGQCLRHYSQGIPVHVRRDLVSGI